MSSYTAKDLQKDVDAANTAHGTDFSVGAAYGNTELWGNGRRIEVGTPRACLAALNLAKTRGEAERHPNYAPVFAVLQAGDATSNYWLTRYDARPAHGHTPLLEMKGITTRAAAEKLVRDAVAGLIAGGKP